LEESHYHLTNKCSGCLYNEHCLKWSAERDDISLIPHLTALDKEALRRTGVTTTRQLAALKDLAPDSTQLTPAEEHAALVQKLATTWPVGPRMDELIHRARLYRRWKKESVEALSYIPSKGHGSLPFSDPTHNPNLVRIFVDAQHDYLQNRLYLLGALVAACEDGQPTLERQRTVVKMLDQPPESHVAEGELLVGFVQAVLQAVVEVAAPDPATGERKAPLHLIFYNRADQKVLLDGLARHLPDILEATPLYDFITQIAAFDSPILTFLDEEMRELKNYPMVCQSLQQVAAYLRFDWRQGEDYRALFKERMFDFWGRLETDQPDPSTGQPTLEWYTNRARFNSEIPLEYAYAAWDGLPDPVPGKDDPFAAYRPMTADLLKNFQARRLEAMAHITADFKGNYLTEKASFSLPDLANFEQQAPSLAHALAEFITIEHHVELGQWKATRNLAPERRVLQGESLLGRYCEADQDLAAAARNRENIRRKQLYERYKAEYEATYPEQKFTPTKTQREETKWNQEGLLVKLRLETTGVDCSLAEALALSNLREGERVIVYRRWAQDERLPEAERTDNTPTPRQMLYGSRAEIVQIRREVDASGETIAATVEIEMQAGRGGAWSKGFAFPSIDRPLLDDTLYTLDTDPNSFYGYWCAVITDGLCELAAAAPSPTAYNALYERLAQPGTHTTAWTPAAKAGQARFLDGLTALHAAGALHDFEPSKREYIGSHGDSPTLLVQGPPGTGKSYSTAFALFARLQGAMAAEQPYRVVVSCKTHAATDVLLQNICEAQKKLRELSYQQPQIFAEYFDARLLSEVSLYRVNGRENPPPGVIALSADEACENGPEAAGRALQSVSWVIAAAAPGGIYKTIKKMTGSGKKASLFIHHFIDCLVLDEASQMNLPEAAMAALPLKREGHLIVVGDHRQMSPIIKHDWETERRRTFQKYRSYDSLFNALRELEPPVPMIKFSESFRLHAVMAEFLRQEIYCQDEIAYYSRRVKVLPTISHPDPFVAAVLLPEHPLVVVVHAESNSQTRNEYEQRLVGPVLEALASPDYYGLDASEGLGVVVPHRAQRAGLQRTFEAQLTALDEATRMVRRSAVDTVERFQGGERSAIVVSATESDRAYLLAAGEFLYDPCRLTVALSRAKQKVILVASQTVFSLFTPEEEAFANARLWKNLLRRTCTSLLWEGEREGHQVQVWGNRLAR
jgi:hypothetical protein